MATPASSATSRMLARLRLLAGATLSITGAL